MIKLKQNVKDYSNYFVKDLGKLLEKNKKIATQEFALTDTQRKAVQTITFSLLGKDNKKWSEMAELYDE